jgi:hypothetical protein
MHKPLGYAVLYKKFQRKAPKQVTEHSTKNKYAYKYQKQMERIGNIHAYELYNGPTR